MNPDEYTRQLQIKFWKKYKIGVRIWVMVANYFFAVLPGILYVMKNIYEQEVRKKVNPSFDNEEYIMMLSFQLFIIIVLGVQMIIHKRFMSFKLVKTQLLGAIVSLGLMLLSISKRFKKILAFRFKTKLREQVMIFTILMGFAYIILLMYGISPISEIKM